MYKLTFLLLHSQEILENLRVGCVQITLHIEEHCNLEERSICVYLVLH